MGGFSSLENVCLDLIGYRVWGGVSHLHFACSPRGKRSEKGEGVSHPIDHLETPKTPQRALGWHLARERSQKFKVMKFWERKCGELFGGNFCPFSSGK